MSARVASSAFLVLLPDPVTPFQGASYSQTQIFRLAPATETTGMPETQSPMDDDLTAPQLGAHCCSWTGSRPVA